MSNIEKERSRDLDRRRERPTRFSDPSRDRDRSIDRGKDRGEVKSSLSRVYVSNIPYEYRWQDLKDLFRSQVGDVAFVELFVDEAEKPRGCGIVEFSDSESVKKCLEVMHRFEINGRKIVIKEDFGNQRDKYGNLTGTSASKRTRERDGGRDRYRDDRRNSGFNLSNLQKQDLTDSTGDNMYGLSPQFLDSLGISIPIINRVFIANLDYKVDKKKLKEIFRLAGKVQRVDLSLDKDGKSRGFAVLEYDHPVEAVQAISMFHNRFLYDRAMTVRMDREGDRPINKLPDGLKGVGMGLGSNGEPLRDVTRNLPSLAQSNQNINVFTPQSNQLGIGTLSGLNNSSVFGGLNANAAVLQAANLAGVGAISNSLLANTLKGGDLGISNSALVNLQNQSISNLSGSRNLGGSSNYSRSELAGSYQSLPLSQNKNYLNGSENRDSHANSNIYGTMNRGSQMPRSSGGMMDTGKSGGYSNKIVINNYPATATYKMLRDKCNEFGNVQNIEDKGNNGIIVTFSREWEAESAIKNMDRARVDGRIIDVRFFY